MKRNDRIDAVQGGAQILMSSMPPSSSRTGISARSIASLSRVSQNRNRPSGKSLGRGHPASGSGLPRFQQRKPAPIQDWNGSGSSGELPPRGHQGVSVRHSVVFQPQQQWAPVREPTIGETTHVEQPFTMSQLTASQHTCGSADRSVAQTHYSGPPAHQSSSQGFESSQNSFPSAASSRAGGRREAFVPARGHHPRGSPFSRPKSIIHGTTEGRTGSSVMSVGQMGHRPPMPIQAALRHPNLTPAQKLLHMGTVRRATNRNPPSLMMGQGLYAHASQSASSVVSNGSNCASSAGQDCAPSHASSGLLLAQQDAESTSGTQGSFKTTRAPMPDHHAYIVDREEFMKALIEELTSHFEAKINDVQVLSSLHNDLSSQMRTQDELMTGFEDRFSKKSSELDTRFSKKSSELDTRFSNMSSELEARMEGLKLCSKNELEDHALRATKHIQTTLQAAKTELKGKLDETKEIISESAREVHETLKSECTRQLDLIKSSAKSWINKIMETPGSLVKTFRNLVPAPNKRTGLLLQSSREDKSLGGTSTATMDVEDIGKRTRTISPAPTRSEGKRLSARNLVEHQPKKRHRTSNQLALSGLSQDTKSSIESSLSLETRSAKKTRSRRTSSAASAIVPLKLLTDYNNKSKVSSRTMKKGDLCDETAASGRGKRTSDVVFTQELLSSISETHYETSVAPSSMKKTQSQSEDGAGKENKTPVPPKRQNVPLITPLAGSTNRGSPKEDIASAFCRTDHEATKVVSRLSKRSTRHKAFTVESSSPRLKPVPENKLSSPASFKDSSQDSDLFPMNEIVTKDSGVCASPLSTISASKLNVQKTSGRARVVTTRKVVAKRRSSATAKPKSKNIVVQRGKKKTYSKRQSAAAAPFPLRDDLDFSFESSEQSAYN